MLTDSKDNLSRQVYGDGTGNMAMCTAQTTVNTLVVSSVQYFAEGMFVDIMATDGTTVKQAARLITSVDSTAVSITVNGSAFTTLATDYVVISGSANLELTGLAKVFTANNTLYGIDRNTNKWFNPTLETTVGSLSETKMQIGLDDAEKAAGGNINFFAASYGVRRAYQNLLVQVKRITDVMQLEGGFSALSYNGMPFTADKYAPASTLFGLDLSTWKKYQLADWDWLASDGAVLTRVADKPVWEATLAKYAEIGCNSPKKNVKWSGVTEA